MRGQSHRLVRELAGNTEYRAWLEEDRRVELGREPGWDPWQEQYGRHVLDNTLQDRIDKHNNNKLQKSQSAVWDNRYSISMKCFPQSMIFGVRKICNPSF